MKTKRQIYKLKGKTKAFSETKWAQVSFHSDHARLEAIITTTLIQHQDLARTYQSI